MTENEPETKPKNKGGRPIKHGGYSMIRKGKLPEDKRVRAYLSSVRAGLVRDLGPDESDLSAAQLIAIDRCLSYLGACRAIEEYVAVDGFIKEGQMNPAINNHYVSFSMGVLRCLALLGFDRKQAEDVIDLGRYKAAKVQEKAKRAHSKPEVDHVEQE